MSKKLFKMKLEALKYRQLYCKHYYRTIEIPCHSVYDNFWVVVNGRVLNLTDLVKDASNIDGSAKEFAALRQLISFGGADISDIFADRMKTKWEMFDIKSKSNFGVSNCLFWWNDPTYEIGRITSQERQICVFNNAKGTQLSMTVCEEDSIYVIQAKYGKVQSEKDNDFCVWRKKNSMCCASGYLYLDKTLTENGLYADGEISTLWAFSKGEFAVCSSFF